MLNMIALSLALTLGQTPLDFHVWMTQLAIQPIETPDSIKEGYGSLVDTLCEASLTHTTKGAGSQAGQRSSDRNGSPTLPFDLASATLGLVPCKMHPLV